MLGNNICQGQSSDEKMYMCKRLVQEKNGRYSLDIYQLDARVSFSKEKDVCSHPWNTQMSLYAKSQSQLLQAPRENMSNTLCR